MKKSHVALGNLEKLVFWSILSLKNWSLANCSAFGASHFCVSFSHGRNSERIKRKFETQNPIHSHISVSTAEKIYFIGESIQLFERDRDLDARGGVLKDQEAEFYNQLAELSESLEFKVADFERFVDTVRETASRHLHTLVLVNADLRGVSSFIHYCDTI